MKTILDAIGDTPLINIEGIWIKMEYLNPSGSIKARIAKYMIERAEKEGLLKPGDTIVEASSGNTGNAMSMVAAVKGYKMLVVMPTGLSQERVAISNPGKYLEFSIEQEDYYPWQVGLFLGNPFKVSNGKVSIPEEPGWGVTINPEWLAKAKRQISEVQ